MRTLTGRMLGFFLIVLGAWGGLVAFVGPLFDYRMGDGPAWNWVPANWQLHVAPGAAVVLGGLLLLIASPRAIARLGAVLALLGGMWFVVGPLFASLWLGTGAETQVASSTLSQALRPLGYHYGTGALVIAAAAYAWASCAAYVRTTPYPGGGAYYRNDAAIEDSRLSTMLGND